MASANDGSGFATLLMLRTSREWDAAGARLSRREYGVARSGSMASATIPSDDRARRAKERRRERLRKGDSIGRDRERGLDGSAEVGIASW